MKSGIYYMLSFFLVFQMSCERDGSEIIPDPIELVSVNVGIKMLSFTEENTGLPIDPQIMIRFTAAVDTVSAKTTIRVSEKLPTSLRKKQQR